MNGPDRRTGRRCAIGAVALIVLCAILSGPAGAQWTDGPLVRPDLRNADGEPMLHVIATTTQVADFARVVGGTLAHVDPILSPNVDPTDYTLGPGDLQRIAFADLVIENGAGLEASWMTPVVHGTPPAVRVMVTNRGARALPTAGQRYGPGWGDVTVPVAIASRGLTALPTSHGDPRVWFAVPNAVRMVANVRDALSGAAPPYASYFRGNAARYTAELNGLDRAIAAQIAALPRDRRTLVTTYGGLAYYAARYKLTFVLLDIPAPGTGGVDVAALAARVRSLHVRAILVMASADPVVTAAIARRAGVRVITDWYGDALGLPGSNGDTYVTMIQTDTRVIVARTAVGGRCRNARSSRSARVGPPSSSRTSRSPTATTWPSKA